MRNSAVIYRNFIKAVRTLSPESQLEAHNAYYDYVLDGVKYEGGNPAIVAIFTLIEDQVEADKAKYEAKKTRLQQNTRKPADIKDVDSDIEEVPSDIVPISSRNRDDIYGVYVNVNVKEKESSKDDSKKKHRHGTYKHVLLTDDENEKLLQKFGEPMRTKLINFLDEAIEEKGYKYKSHYLTIAKEGSWVQERVRGKPSKQTDKAGVQRGTDYDAMVLGGIT